MRGVHGMKVCNGRMVTSFVLLFRIGKIMAKGCCEGGQEKWSSPRRLSFMVYRIITEWWKLESSGDISSWRSRSKQLKGRWKFSFKNTHSCLKHIDLAPLPSTSKVISLIDSGRNTLFSCHRHHNGSLLRIYCTYREREGEGGMLRAWRPTFEITIHRVTSASHQSCNTFPFHKLKFPSITNTWLQMKSIGNWTSKNTDKAGELRKRQFAKCGIAIIRV